MRVFELIMRVFDPKRGTFLGRKIGQKPSFCPGDIHTQKKPIIGVYKHPL
jgi:hypothetical protein